MNFKAFEAAARRSFEEIPKEYREGLDGLVILREALPHPTQPDIYTLGMCVTESYPSDWQGPETTRSVVELYYGSFRSLARLDPEFDWDEELWETLTHELRHHLESLANQDRLEAVDYAMDQGFRRADGEDFDPWYYQNGDPVGPGIYRVEHDFFLEQEWTADAFEAATDVEFSWHGVWYRVPRPAELGDVHYLMIEGVDVGPGYLDVVLLRKRTAMESLRRLFKRTPPEVFESEATAAPRGGRNLSGEAGLP